jgi:hypothetical protein
MADFLVIYQGGDPKWMETWAPEKIQSVMQEWGAWFKELEASGNLRNPGAALAPGGVTLTRNGSGIKTDTAMSEVKELIGGYSVIHAADLAEATELAKGTPFLKHQDGNVVVRPVMEQEG